MEQKLLNLEQYSSLKNQLNFENKKWFFSKEI
jgi:hypothetical protein